MRIKIIPTSLDELLELSDEMRTWPLNFAAHQRCHWCRNEPDHITTCDGCGVIGYCNSVRRPPSIDRISMVKDESANSVLGL